MFRLNVEEKKTRASRESMGGGGMGGFSDRPPMGRGERGSQVRVNISVYSFQSENFFLFESDPQFVLVGFES
jgi:hypothetical protein